MKYKISDIIVPFVVLLSGFNVALMDVISYSLRMEIIIGMAVFFTLIIAFVHLKKRGKNENNQKI